MRATRGVLLVLLRFLGTIIAQGNSGETTGERIYKSIPGLSELSRKVYRGQNYFGERSE